MIDRVFVRQGLLFHNCMAYILTYIDIDIYIYIYVHIYIYTYA